MNSKNKNALIGGLLAIVFVMAVGYAAFSTQLNVNGTANVTSSWDVHIQSITAGTTDAGTLTGTAQDLGTSIGEDKLSATFSNTLMAPGDSITYTIVVKNAGTLPAKVSDIVFTKGASKAILYNYSGIAENDVVSAGATKTFTVTVTYDSAITSQPDTADTTSTLSMVLSFVQSTTGA